MRIFHTADWHIGHLLYGNNRVEEHEHFLKWLLSQVRSYKPDVFLAVGDIFDGTLLSGEDERIFWDFLMQLTRDNPQMRVILTTGDSDDVSYVNSSLSVFHRVGVQVRSQIPRNGRGEIDYEELCIPVNAIEHPDEQIVILAVPVDREGMADNGIYEQLVKMVSKRFSDMPIVVMAHGYAKGARTLQTNGKDYAIGYGVDVMDFTPLASKVAYIALGHIHQAQAIAGYDNIWYAGSPLSLSFEERDYSLGINMVDIESKDSVKIKHLEYKPLRKLLTIPSDSGCSYKEAEKYLASFDKISRNDDSVSYPYVELKIREDNPTPEMLETLQAMASERCVKLCRIERVMSEKAMEETYPDLSADDLQQLVPGRMIREMYHQRYSEDMMDEMARLVADVKRTGENADLS